MSRKVIKLYLASPSDLTEERRLLPDILRQINESKASGLNLFFEAVDRDDAGPGELAAREITTKIVNCDLFVLLLWKRYGERGEDFRSVIEEEFRIADAAYKHSRRPQILLYFRSVLPSMMADPGEQLQQVIRFRNIIEEEKTHSFTIYDQPNQWKDLLLLNLSHWLDKYRKDINYSGTHEDKQILIPSVVETLSLRLQGILEGETLQYPVIEQKRRTEALRYAVEALHLANAGKITLAEEGFAKSLELYEDPEVLYSFGLFMHQLGSLDRSENAFQRLLDYSLFAGEPGRLYQAQAIINLGMVYASRALKARMPETDKRPIERLLLERFARSQNYVRSFEVEDYFERLTQVASRRMVAHGLAAAFRSKYTEPFGQLVSHLYSHSDPQPQAHVLRTLISTLGGPPGISTLARRSVGFYELNKLIKTRPPALRFASDVPPEIIQELASQAEQMNLFTVDHVSRVYSAYPEVVKHMGVKPLTIALSSMVEREAENRGRAPLLNYIVRGPDALNVTWHEFPFIKRTEKGSRRRTRNSSGKSVRTSTGDIDIRHSTQAESTERPPLPLFANSWFEDAMMNALPYKSPLVAGSSYRFLFGIEAKKREGAGRSEPFAEPRELRRAEKQRVHIEVVCSLLDMKSKRGVMRRTVDYYSGKGIRPQPFPLKPLKIGEYFLTVRLFYIRQILYRAIIPLQVMRVGEASARTRLELDNSFSSSAALTR